MFLLFSLEFTGVFYQFFFQNYFLLKYSLILSDNTFLSQLFLRLCLKHVCCSHNLPEYCIAFHGLARAGLTVTTCNPVYTVEETQHQLRDSNAKAVITVDDYLDKVKQITAGLNNCQSIWVMGEFAGPGEWCLFWTDHWEGGLGM